LWVVAAFAVLSACALVAFAYITVVRPRVERKAREERWVNAACSAAEAHLHAADAQALPTGAGAFQGLSGSGYQYPVWNINAPHLIAPRIARFANKEITLLVYVWEPAPGASDQGQWDVENIEQPSSSNVGQMKMLVRRR
jgi:hypothetical protein